VTVWSGCLHEEEARMAVDGKLTLREGRGVYFAENGLPADGGYADRWVVVKVASIPVFVFPNTEGRRRDVPFHDLHHVLTGYGTTVVGEAEIGAWELGSDCTASPAAVFLNCQVCGFVLPRHPRRLFRAFTCGRRARNLYGTSCYDEILSRPVGVVREALGIDAPPGEPTPEDRRAFLRWSARALATTWGPLAPILALGWWIWS